MSVAPHWRFFFANADDSAGAARARWSAAFSVISVLFGPVGGPAFAGAQVGTQSAGNLKQLSLEELMNVEVTSVSKTEESLRTAAAAVAVVTGEDIKRSGAMSVPEALRSVPGLHVAMQTASGWAVSSRGFSSVNSEKLLVLSDTRSVYTPLYSGVFWNVQNYLLNDVDRIEVIRGPGATLWGSNAVNGVINITTKGARETQGAYVETEVGTQDRVSAAARYGSTVGETSYYRVFGTYTDHAAEQHPAGSSPDDWRLGHVGFRSDGGATEADAWTLEGDLYDGTVGLVAPSVTIIGRPGLQGTLQTTVSGGNVLGRWRHRVSADADVELRLYYDRTHRADPSFLDDLDTVDADFQHHLLWGRRHELTWGLGYRLTINDNHGKGIFAVEPPVSRDQLVSGFVQDQFTIRDTLRLTLGTKLEHNDYSGFEWQPSIRLAWESSSRHTLWGAVSHAVRVPTRIERDIDIALTDPTGNPVIRLLGNKDFRSEQLLAFELGDRWQVAPEFVIDLAAFHDRYRTLASLEVGTPFVDPTDGRTVFPVVNENLTHGRANGAEALLTYSPARNWRLSATYSFLDLRLRSDGMDLNRGVFRQGSTPRNQAGLRVAVDLPAGFQLDAAWRYTSDIRSLPDIVAGGGVPGYTDLDLRCAWRTGRGVELSIVGRNLLHGQHIEFGAPATRSAIERSVYGKVAWVF